MTPAKVINVLILFSLSAIILGVVFDPGIVGLGCANGGFLCNNPLEFLPGEPFMALGVSFFLTCYVLKISPKPILKVWAKFAVPSFIIMIAVIAYTYSTPHSGGFSIFPTDEQIATVLLPALFVVISLIIIFVKGRKVRES